MSTCNCPSCYARRGWESRVTAQSEALASMMVPHDVRIPPPAKPLRERVVEDVLDGLRKLNAAPYGLGIPDEYLQERARNIAQGLLGNYRIEDINDKGDHRG